MIANQQRNRTVQTNGSDSIQFSEQQVAWNQCYSRLTDKIEARPQSRGTPESGPGNYIRNTVGANDTNNTQKAVQIRYDAIVIDNDLLDGFSEKAAGNRVHESISAHSTDTIVSGVDDVERPFGPTHHALRRTELRGRSETLIAGEATLQAVQHSRTLRLWR